MAASKNSTKGVFRAPGRAGHTVVAGAAVCAAAMVMTATGVGAADWSITPSISASETYTDNVNLRPNGNKDPALITQLTPAVAVRGTGARLNLGLNSSVDLRYQTLNDHEKSVDVNLAGTADAEVLEELFFVEASATISQEAVNQQAATSASSSNNQNLDTVQTYRVSPFLVHRLGNFANAEERYTFNRFDSSGSSVSSSYTHTVELSLNSGTDFSRFLWGLSALARNDIETNDEDELERRADGNFEVVIDPSFSLLASGGYESLDFGGTRDDIEEPTWNGGFRWKPSSRTEIEARYGRRFGGEFKEASAHYDITPRTTLSGTLTTSLDEPQSRSSNNVSFIGVDASGNLIDTRTGEPFDATAGNLSLSDERQRTTTYTTRLTSEIGRNTFSLAASKEKQKGLFSGTEDDAVLVTGNWARQLSPRSSMNAFTSFERSTFGGDGRRDNEYTFIGSFTYNIFENANATLSYSYKRRDSTLSSSKFTENAVTVGASYSF